MVTALAHDYRHRRPDISLCFAAAAVLCSDDECTYNSVINKVPRAPKSAESALVLTIFTTIT